MNAPTPSTGGGRRHIAWRELASRAALFRAPVARELELVERELSRLLPQGDGLIDEVSEHLLSTCGKRFRPALLLLTAEMAGAACREEKVTVAAVVELVHTATLIHDDAIDGSLLRRGRPTVNHRWNDRVSVLMGDYVYSKVFKMLADSKMFGSMGVLAESTNAMTIAEMTQIERKNDVEITEGDYMMIIDGKTASLIAASCEIGAMVAGRHDGVGEVYSSFGRHVGIAFQIVDDILDFVGDNRILGKPRGTDLSEGNITLPLIAALRTASRSDRSRMQRLASAQRIERNSSPGTGNTRRAGPVEDEALEELVHLIDRNEGFAYAMEKAAESAKTAKSLLFPFPDSPSREALLSAADYVVQRGLCSVP